MRSLTRFGTPAWEKYVFYTLQGNGSGTAKLLRYERPTSAGSFQVLSSHLPSSSAGNSTLRIISKQVLDQGWAARQTNEGRLDLVQQKDAPGGFSVKFLRQDGSTSTISPSQADPAVSTRLLEVRLTILTTSDQGMLSALPIRFRVAPRN